MTASRKIHGCRRSSKERRSCRALSCHFTPHGPLFCKCLVAMSRIALRCKTCLPAISIRRLPGCSKWPDWLFSFGDFVQLEVAEGCCQKGGNAMPSCSTFLFGAKPKLPAFLAQIRGYSSTPPQSYPPQGLRSEYGIYRGVTIIIP